MYHPHSLAALQTTFRTIDNPAVRRTGDDKFIIAAPDSIVYNLPTWATLTTEQIIALCGHDGLIRARDDITRRLDNEPTHYTELARTFNQHAVGVRRFAYWDDDVLHYQIEGQHIEPADFYIVIPHPSPALPSTASVSSSSATPGPSSSAVVPRHHYKNKKRRSNDDPIEALLHMNRDTRRFFGDMVVEAVVADTNKRRQASKGFAEREAKRNKKRRGAHRNKRSHAYIEEAPSDAESTAEAAPAPASDEPVASTSGSSGGTIDPAVLQRPREGDRDDPMGEDRLFEEIIDKDAVAPSGSGDQAAA
ncbi:hypothetical protein BJ912DRAFT_924425 [Pholiota molesta]|nr:hypothetical protein BJ912DRAFT_924425 [Pholiota molesta]